MMVVGTSMVRILIFLCLCSAVSSQVQNNVLSKILPHDPAVLREIVVQHDRVDKTASRLKAEDEQSSQSNSFRNINIEAIFPFLKPYIELMLGGFAPTSDKVKNQICRNHSKIYIQELVKFTPWAIQMLDATGKIPDGIFVGNVHSLGHFSECLSVRVALTKRQVEPEFQGKYCYALLQRRPNVSQTEDNQVQEQTMSPETTTEIHTLTATAETAAEQNTATTTAQQNNETTIAEQNTATTIAEQNKETTTAEQNAVTKITEQNTVTMTAEKIRERNTASEVEDTTATTRQNKESSKMEDSSSTNKNTKVLALSSMAGLDFGSEILDAMLQTTIPTVGLCVPSSCTEEDVETSLNDLLSPFNNENVTYLATVAEGFCYAEEEVSYRAADIAVMSLYSLLLCLVLAGTIFDVCALYKPHWYICNSASTSTFSKALKSFSLMFNGKKLFGTEQSSEVLGCLHGLRFISISWVILGHAWLMAVYIPWANPGAAVDVFNDWAMHSIMNATVSVDTFFVLSGVLVSYFLLRELDKRGKINPVFFVVHRYIRLTPTYALVLAFMATLIEYMGSGPFWHSMHVQAEYCRKNWWTNLLYVNNFVNQEEACMGETWYLACDMHMYLISPLIIYPLWRWTRPGLVWLTLLIIGSLGIRGALIYLNDYPLTVLPYRTPLDYIFEFYMRSYTRMAPYLVGILMGYILHQTRNKSVKIKPGVVIIGWLAASAVGLSIVYGTYDYIKFDYVIASTEVAIAYGTLHRFAWSVALSWVIFACIKGYGGFVNTLLSWKMFMPLSRLTYCSYLIHMHVQWLFHYSRKFVMVYDWYLMVYFFFGHLMVTLGASVVLSLVFEAPFISLGKLAFRQGGQVLADSGSSRAPNSGGAEMTEIKLEENRTNGVKSLPTQNQETENRVHDNAAFTKEDEENKLGIKSKNVTQYERIDGQYVPKTEL